MAEIITFPSRATSASEPVERVDIALLIRTVESLEYSLSVIVDPDVQIAVFQIDDVIRLTDPIVEIGRQIDLALANPSCMVNGTIAEANALAGIYAGSLRPMAIEVTIQVYRACRDGKRRKLAKQLDDCIARLIAQRPARCATPVPAVS